jgi:hypothetical protein
MDRSPVGALENESLFVERPLRISSPVDRDPAMFTDHNNGTLVESDDTSAPVRLGQAHLYMRADQNDRLNDPQLPTLEIDIAPAKAEKFTPTQSSRRS